MIKDQNDFYLVLYRVLFKIRSLKYIFKFKDSDESRAGPAAW